MSMRDSSSGGGGGGLVRDGATQTGRAVILIVVAIVVAVVLLHHNKPPAALTASTSTKSTSTTLATTATTLAPTATTTATTTPATTTPSTVPVANVKVLVLNGASFSQAYAGEFTNKLKTAGYNTLTPNNATRTVKSSAIYVITSGYAPEAQALATTLGLPASAIKAHVPAVSPLPSGITATGANLVLVVGPDLASKGA